MQKESLIKIRKAIIDLAWSLEDIPKEDRFDICMNENLFLDPEKYEDNIKVLQKHNKKKQL